MTEEGYSSIPEDELKALKAIPIEYWILFLHDLVVCEWVE